MKSPVRKKISFLFIAVVFAATLVGSVGLSPRPVFAQQPVADAANLTPNTFSVIATNVFKAATEAYNKAKDALGSTAAIAYRNGLTFFLQSLAKDTASWIATGGRGQQPLFVTQGWGSYLADAGDSAVGTVIDTLSRDGGPLQGFNICNPNVSVLLRINLGLANPNLQRPRCTFTEMLSNWETEIARGDFLPRVQQSFNTDQTPLGVALLLNNVAIEQSQLAREVFKNSRLEGVGFEPVTDLISGNIETPGNLVASTFYDALGAGNNEYLIATGDVIADSVNLFTNTLVSKVLTNLLQKGIGGGSNRQAANRTLADPNAQIMAEGVRGAQIRLAHDITPSFSTPGQYDALSQLAGCQNASNPGPNSCAITQNMRTAIAQRLTVKQAVEKGLFNANGPFGFVSQDAKQPIEPSYTDGVPYRSILLLRKYRIVPVGWELAARYIQHFDTQTRTLKDIMDRYDDIGSPFYRLIDPNWAFVSPDAFCKLQGPGPEILSLQTTAGIDINNDGKYDGPNEKPPSVEVDRNANYCADEQTCLYHDDKGNCQFYGYCMEEKRTWNFGQNSCEAKYNTCTTLAKADGTSVSYMLNTVDKGTCDANAVGCTAYSREKNMVPHANEADDWISTPNAQIYLNAKAETCDADNAGCRAYIRPGYSQPSDSLTGTNLVANGGFEAVPLPVVPSTTIIGWRTFDRGITNMGIREEHIERTGDAFEGKSFLKFSHTIIDAIFPLSTEINTTGLNISGKTFTVSFAARNVAGGSFGGVRFDTGNIENSSISSDPVQFADRALTSEWKHYSGTVRVSSQTPGTALARLHFFGFPIGADIDAVSLTVGAQSVPYAPYGVGTNAVVHIKRAPDYLSAQSSGNAYHGTGSSCRPTRPADNATDAPDRAVCQPYARYCLPQEAGCMSYTPANGSTAITSVRGDSCPAQCVGYDTYTQSKTFFESSKFVDLIPTSAKKCNAAQAGCDEFTNVDAAAAGGETKEYYRQIRYCQKPNDSNRTTYYTWEGSDTNGFQLRVFELLASNNAVSAPCVTPLSASAENVGCNEASVSAPLLSCQATFGSNPDCRQFYDTNGAISYRPLSKTISITADCHPYRKTESTRNDCEASGGWWNEANSACIYQAVPKQGLSCQAAAAGCREYRGGTAGSYRVLFTDTFENDTSGWNGGQLSAVSNDLGGHSYQFGAGVSKLLTLSQPNTPTAGGAPAPFSYTISFWARKTDATLPGEVIVSLIRLGDKVFPAIPFIKIMPTNDWVFYQSDPIPVDMSQTNGTAGLNFYKGPGGEVNIDNIVFKSNANTYYLIKSSSQVPAICNTNTSYLGCQSYKVSDDKTRNIYQFGAACSPKVVGCEAVIDTQNTTSGPSAPFAKTWSGVCVSNSTGQTNKVSCNTNSQCGSGYTCSAYTVPADVVDFIVNTKAKQCHGSFQGCEELGKPKYAPNKAVESWESVYLKNNPNAYDGTTSQAQGSGILCRQDQLQCSAYVDSGGQTLYFKDPGESVCEYRDSPQAGWYIKNSQASSPNCNRALSDALPRTLASSVAKVGEPKDGFVGLCPAVQNNCREFVDPRSDDANNLLYNGSFVLPSLTAATLPQEWTPFGNSGAPPRLENNTVLLSQGGISQNVQLESRRYYVLSAEVGQQGSSTSLGAYIGLDDCTGGTVLPDQSGPDQTQSNIYSFIVPAAAESPTRPTFERFSTMFYVTSVNAPSGVMSCGVRVGTAVDLLPDSAAGRATFTNGSSTNRLVFKNVSVREVRLNYQLADKIDRRTCIGAVDNTSCVVVNDRGNGLTVAQLSINADNSPQAKGSADGASTTIASTNTRDEYTCIEGKCRGTNRACTAANGEVAAECQMQFNAQTVVKVIPDRQCAAWLSCKTARTITVGGVTKSVCLDVEGCQELDPKTGSCISNVPEFRNTNLTYTPANVDLIKNKSGFSKVGFDWTVPGGTTQLLQGYLPPQDMEQIPHAISLVNGNFESSPGGLPAGWLVGPKSDQRMRVIDNPVDAERVGVAYPMEGRKFVEVNASQKLPGITAAPPIPQGTTDTPMNVTDFIPVSPNTDYAISAYLNTLHFVGKATDVRIYQYTSGRAFSRPERPYDAVLNLGGGFGWTLLTDVFRTADSTSFIRIQLTWVPHNSSDCDEQGCKSGFWYIDDLKVSPALRYQLNEYKTCSNNREQRCSTDAQCGGAVCTIWYANPDFPQLEYEQGLNAALDTRAHYAGQSCQLYPKADSPSCKYVDSKGIRYAGKPGYCLEWDPQNSNYCLQWWPVDSVIGQDSEEDRAGYADRTPLYYCLNARVPSNVDSNGYVEIIKEPSFDLEVSDSKVIRLEDHDEGGCKYDYKHLHLDPGTATFTLAQAGSDKDRNVGPIVGITDVPGDCGIDGGPGCEIGIRSRDTGGCNTEKANYTVELGYQTAEGIVWKTLVDKISVDARGEGALNYFDLKDLNTPGIHYTHIRLSTEDGPGETNITELLVRPVYGCTAIAQVVNPSGGNAAWASRLAVNSSYSTPGNSYRYNTDYAPYGGVVPPEPVEDPTAWYPTSNSALRLLPVEPPISSLGNGQSLGVPYQVRAGSPYSCTSTQSCQTVAGRIGIIDNDPDAARTQAINSLKTLFAESYGVWVWNGVSYVPRNDLIWSRPTTLCDNNIRAAVGSGCAVAPAVPKITLSQNVVSGRGRVSLTFTAVVDPDQAPLTQYVVDWGDGNQTVMSGLRLQSRPTDQSAITLSHNYSFDALRRSGDCGSGCRVNSLINPTTYFLRPRVQILDNWGWCNANYVPNGNSNPLFNQLGYHVSSGNGCALTSSQPWTSSTTEIELKQ